MMSKRVTGIVLMVIITISVIFPMSQVKGAPETQNIYIVDTINDGFVTESGILWDDNPLVYVTDPNMDIRSFAVFRDIEINRWEFLNNATLRFYTPGSFDADLDSSITIYGVNQHNFQGFESAAQVLSAPLTNNRVIYNTSAFTGSQMHNIDVTEIVRELIGHITWTGDGHSGTDDKDNLGFVMLGASGHDLRYFYDFGVGNNLGPRLTIQWGDIPTPPTPTLPPPDDADEPEFNETNRGLVIWSVDNNGENRTGAPANGSSVNWNLLNQTQLTEQDSGAAINPINDTYTDVNGLRAQQIASMFNNTGAPADIDTFFLRLAIEITSVNNVGVGEQPLGSVASVSTVGPTGSNGLAWGVAGDWAGLVLTVNDDDTRFRYLLRERSGAADANAGASQWFTENTGFQYIEFRMKYRGNHTFIQVRIYDDPAFTNLIHNAVRNMTIAAEPFQYAQTLASGGAALNNDAWTFDYYTYLIDPLAPNVTWTVTYPNGTIIVEGLDDYDDAIIFIDDLLGSDPVDPDPPGQGWPQTGPFTRFRFRFYILLVGVVMIFGPLMVFAMKRPSGYDFTIGLFIMFVGFALMYAAGQT